MEVGICPVEAGGARTARVGMNGLVDLVEASGVEEVAEGIANHLGSMVVADKAVVFVPGVVLVEHQVEVSGHPDQSLVRRKEVVGDAIPEFGASTDGEVLT